MLTHSDGDHHNLVNDLIIKPQVQVDSALIGGAITDYGGTACWLNQKEQALTGGLGPDTQVAVRDVRRL